MQFKGIWNYCVYLYRRIRVPPNLKLNIYSLQIPKYTFGIKCFVPVAFLSTDIICTYIILQYAYCFTVVKEYFHLRDHSELITEGWRLFFACKICTPSEDWQNLGIHSKDWHNISTLYIIVFKNPLYVLYVLIVAILFLIISICQNLGTPSEILWDLGTTPTING